MSIIQQLNEKSFQWSYASVEDDPSLVITTDLDLASQLGSYTRLVKQWAQGQGLVVQARHNKHFNQPVVRVLSGYERLPRVLLWLSHCYDDDSFRQYIELSPYLQLLYQLFEPFPFSLEEPYWRALRGDEAKAFSQALNQHIRDFRTQVNSTEFKAKLASGRRLMHKNRQALTSLFNGLFVNHARLLVVRLDTGFGDELKPRVTAKGLHRYRAQLIAYVQSNFTDLLGYAWKIEFMPKKGFHIHWLWLFDANRVRADVLIAQRIGEYWQKTITQGGGVYYNANANKRSYERCAVGEVKRSDVMKRADLSIVVDYLTKTDDYIRAKLPDHSRSFGKSVVKSKSTKRFKRNK